MEGNQMMADSAQPLEFMVANDAVAICEKLESDFRNKGDFCHNNIGSKTCDDWERMDKLLVDAANNIRSVHDCVKSLIALYSRQKLRQCDMGTPEEQAERYNAFCRKHFTPDKLGGNCRKCPLRNRRGWSCQLAWAQMPYAEEGGTK